MLGKRQAITDWAEHATLYVLDDDGLARVAAGSLAAMVETALHFEDRFDSAVIETDGKVMFCRAEIAMLASDATRPPPEGRAAA